MKDYAPRHFLHPQTHAAKLEKAIRYLGVKHCLARPVSRINASERVSLLDRWRATRHSA
jgi:hypothetical protein